MRSGLFLRAGSSAHTRAASGLTMVELCIVAAIIMIMAVISIPIMKSTLEFYQLQGASASLSGAIQSTRYRAISDGYPYSISFTKSTTSFEQYQVASCPAWDPANPTTCTLTNIGNAIPFGDTKGAVQLNANVSLKFWPGGRVEFLTGSNPITLTRVVGRTTKTKSITVSTYGNVKVQ